MFTDSDSEIALENMIDALLEPDPDLNALRLRFRFFDPFTQKFVPPVKTQHARKFNLTMLQSSGYHLIDLSLHPEINAPG
jgi:hypothetical protein